MDTQMIRTLFELNSLQTLGAVRSVAEPGAANTEFFQTLLAEIGGDPSVTDALTNLSATALGSLQTPAGTLPFGFSPAPAVHSPADAMQLIDRASASRPPLSYAGAVDLKTVYAPVIDKAAKQHDVPAALIAAVIQQESGFNKDVVSYAGAQGLMQLMPGTARFLGVKDASDPEQNIMGGAKYLRQMLDQFSGDLRLSLAAYNAGPGNVRKYGGVPPFRETQNYVTKVMRNYDSYRA